MTSRQHQDWINHGKPDSGLALPLQLLANTLSGHGYVVYVYPNDAHLDAEPPEDHTYYSETGWPGASPKWWRHAIDIMPTHGGADLYALGQRIVADRNRGLAKWIKYINVPTDATLKHATQHRWEPGHSQGSSSDTGHIHISGVTGCETLDSAYDPLTTVVVASSTTEGTDMDLQAIGEIVPSTTNAQVIRDLWDMVADAADPGTPATGRNRFKFPPQVAAVRAEQAAQGARITALQSAVTDMTAALARIEAWQAAQTAAGLPHGQVAVSGTLAFGSGA